jgi:hypothetical protein
MPIRYAESPAEGGRCPRCDKPWSSHAIKHIDYNDKMQLQLGSIEAPGKMLGILHAVADGQELNIMAASGFENVLTASKPPGKSWINADNARFANGIFYDVYGRSFRIADFVQLDRESDLIKACAAIKLLHKLGEIASHRKKSPVYSQITMMEERYPGSLKDWKGQGKVGSADQYAAHSCDACKKRLPYFLCSNPLTD